MSVLMSLLLAVAVAVTPESRAQDVLDRMREALGGESRLAAVRSLSVEAELRRVVPGEGGESQDMSGEVGIEALLPDRYLRVETLSPLPGAPRFSVGSGLDGGEAWMAPIGTPGHGVVVRIGAPSTPEAAAALRRRLRAELARILLVSLGAGPADFPLAFAYAGEAQAPEGRAQLVDVTGPDGFKARLFVDATSHLPLMLTFRTAPPRVQVMRAMGGHGAPPPPDAQASGPAPEVDAKLFVSAYKGVDGLNLPHSFSQSIEGGPSEEWQIRRWKVNPSLKPDNFRKRP